MSDAAAARQAKYRRLLPRLGLGRALYTRGTVTVHCIEPFDDLCDVTFRLVDEAGRTHAERSVTMDADTPPIGLGGTVNLPPGGYAVLATPPLPQFWGAVPVQHRMALTVAPPLCTEEPADAVSRAVAVRTAMEARDAPEAWLALFASVTPQAGDALLDFARASLSAAVPSDGPCVEDAWPGAGVVGGIDVTGPDLHPRMIALAALASTQGGDLADWAAAQLDAHAFALALASADGLPVTVPGVAAAVADPHAALAWFLWGRGVADTAAPVVRALALAGYRPPPVLAAVARATGPQAIRLAPRGRAGLGLWREGGLAVAASGSSWTSVLSPDVRLSGSGALRLWHDGPALRALHAASTTIAVPLWALQDLRVDADLVTGRCGELGVALASTAPLRRDPLAPEAGVLLEGRATVVCIAGPAGDALPEAARDLLREAWPSGDADGPANAIDSPYCCAAADAQALTIRVGDAVLSLDLSAPRAAADGGVP